MIICNKCLKSFNENEIQQHHLLPYAIFGTEGMSDDNSDT